MAILILDIDARNAFLTTKKDSHWETSRTMCDWVRHIRGCTSIHFMVCKHFLFGGGLPLRWKKRRKQRLLCCKRLLAFSRITMMYGKKKTKEERGLYCYVRCWKYADGHINWVWNMACFDICNIILSSQIICGNTFVLSKPFCLSVWFYELHLSISAISSLVQASDKLLISWCRNHGSCCDWSSQAWR